MNATVQPLPPEFAQALRELGLAGDAAPAGTPLEGGVSSDIWRIETPSGPVCAKRALPKLRVAADWRAPISTLSCSVRSLTRCSSVLPGAAGAMPTFSLPLSRRVT